MFAINQFAVVAIFVVTLYTCVSSANSYSPYFYPSNNNQYYSPVENAQDESGEDIVELVPIVRTRRGAMLMPLPASSDQSREFAGQLIDSPHVLRFQAPKRKIFI